ncbi:protein HTATIP2-like [Tubulanus polymorphus]|uniref:protein HTATIP2-like n=1 Tax=Tubulanus polymorphus TaxID=672921 RepID=UPI003DA22EE3
MTVFRAAAYIVLFTAVLIPGYLIYMESIPLAGEEECFKVAEGAEQNTAMFKEKGLTAFVVGYTGATGRVLVRQLLEKQIFKRLVLIGRRKVEFEDDLYKDVEQKIVDFDNLSEHADAFADTDVGYCCLGTTRGKSGVEGFKKVDYEYVMKTAEVSKSAGTKHFHLMSSLGANKNSRFLYPQTKGKIEADVAALGFEHMSIYRPGVLLTKRDELRPAEWIFQGLLKPLTKISSNIGASTETVAEGIIVNTVSAETRKPTEILENKHILILTGDIKKK